MANDLTKLPAGSLGAADLIPSMVCYLVETAAAATFPVYCGFFPSKVVIYEDDGTGKKLEWNAAMGGTEHFTVVGAVAVAGAAMVTPLTADQLAANGNGFTCGAVLTASSTAYMEVYR